MSSFGSTPQRGSSSFGVGGTTQPNTGNTSVLRDQEVARQNQAITEARRVAGNQQFIAGKQARSQATKQDFLKQRKQKRAEVLGLVQQNQGRQEARIFQQRMERAVKLGERTPLPEGINVDLGDQDNLDKLREAGFDVPKRVPRAALGGPSADFEVDRVSQGNNVEDVGPRLRPLRSQPQPQPEPEPSAFESEWDSLQAENRRSGGGASGGLPEPEREVPLIDRRKERTGGASGGLPQQRSAPTDSRSTQQILQEFRPMGNVGLSRQRTAPAGAQQTQDPAQILRDFRTAQQLQSAPLGRDQQPQEPATGPLGDNTPRSRAKRLKDRLTRG